MILSPRSLLWSLATSLSLAVTAQADVIESAPADVLSAAPVPLPASPAAAPSETSTSPGEEAAAAVVPGDKSADAELIQERYPNREVKIERQVVQDASGNYVNHGKWVMYDERGHMVGCGQYRYGERHGPWTRWHMSIGSKDMLAQMPYKQFQPPFVSEVTFDNGRVNGKWKIYDKQDRVCSEFNFENGERQGKSVWYYPNGVKMREIDFTAGQYDGQAREWGPDKKLTKNDTYQDGRRLGKKSEAYANGQPKIEATYLFAREVLKCNYDWWEGNITTTIAKEGKDQRHGLYTTWYKNGQKDEEGQYLNDLAVGKCTWWYENGQKAIDGQFINGERNGHWTWWHENGQKSADGEFVKGVEIGKWTWWAADGKVTNSARITEGQTKTVVEVGEEVVEQEVAAAPPAPKAKPQGKSPVKQARGGTRRPATPPANVRR